MSSKRKIILKLVVLIVFWGMYNNAFAWWPFGNRTSKDKNPPLSYNALSGNAMFQESANAKTKVTRINNLGYATILYKNISFDVATDTGIVQTKMVWYMSSHGASGNIECAWSHTLIPDNLPGNLTYTLVVLDACETFLKSSEWKQHFNTSAFLGWNSSPLVLQMTGFTDYFFDQLKGFKTVDQAYTSAKYHYQNISKLFLPSQGEPDILGGTTVVDISQ